MSARLTEAHNRALLSYSASSPKKQNNQNTIPMDQLTGVHVHGQGGGNGLGGVAEECEGRGKEFVNNLRTLKHKISTFCMLCLTKYPEYHCFIFAVRLINSSNPSEKSPHL